ncbi:hypothetical protein DACRYDRAFT_106153 [Dacryopinax primogenitus]|uniref:F-box domain-containing protein n=1 Tax=Dacryopinax primogenitus (strain DJM 731) TaxID=1858805 RepID=M5GAJ6_DACPD|nr:uncharacterized protein DACRYDRAFT_106153 [Dacryopinax primogenitus]EJU02977.1 hypothetical protein DACRYDRAFT_106153 [Dacryopinax primogenitus]
MSNVWSSLVFSTPKYLADEDFKPIHPWYGSASLRALSDMYTSNLERSKQSLLNVQMHIPEFQDSRMMINEYMHVCTNRVAVLTLEASTSNAEGMNAIVQCVTQTRETLRRLRIDIYQTTTDELGRDTMELLLLCSLPRLVEVELENMPLPLVHRPEYTAFLQCRRLHLELNPQMQYTPSRLIALLKCAPQLQRLHLVVYPQHQDQAGAEPGFHLPRMPLPELRSLTFKSTCVGRHGHTLGRLTAPKIESLSLSVFSPFDAHDEQDAYVDDLVEFITASSGPDGAPSPLKTLSVQGGILRGFDRILRVTPGLEVLTLVSAGHWSPFEEEECVAPLRRLGMPCLQPLRGNITSVVGVSSLVLCPKLQTIESLWWATPSHIRLLTTIASRRRSSGIPLTRIRMGNWPPPAAIDMPATPSEQYALEKELAREVEVLECGGYRWDWKEEGRWIKLPNVGDPQFPTVFAS